MAGTVFKLESIDDARIDDYRSVPDPELLRTHGLFVAEGRFVVQRVIDDDRYRVRSVLVTDVSLHALEPQLATLPDGTPVYTCAADAFRSLTAYNLHRGCLALVERPPAAHAADLIHGARRVVLLEEVSNPDNVGGVFRNAAAFGVDAVLLSPGCCDPFYRKAIRTSMGATLRVPFARLPNWPVDLQALRDCGFLIAALTPNLPADSLATLASGTEGRVALMAGAEGSGLTDAVLAVADMRVRIPITSAVDSLNVSVALAIALHAISSPG